MYNQDNSTGEQNASNTPGEQYTNYTTGDQSTSYTTGNQSTSYTTGDQSTSYTTGNQSTSYTTGDQSTSYASGGQYTNYTTGGQYSSYTPGGQSTYTGSAYNYGGYTQQTHPSSGSKKKGSGTFKKFAVGVGTGLFLGLTAGFSFFGVAKLTGALDAARNINKTAEPSQNNQYVAEVSPTIKELQNSDVKKTEAQDVSGGSADVSDVVEEVMPAMVSIVNTGTEITNFWGQNYSRETSSSGSGIIIGEKDGELLIVTNHHVASGADTLEVTFINGTTARAYAKGMDSEMDLAVLSVDKGSLDADTLSAISIATLGDSDDLKLGKPVIVIGNALGYGQSVTSGIISGLNREITMEDGSTGTFIQTNAAVNPGNSGGALLNINGEVIGIVSSKIGGTTIEGMGYAIPISAANPIIADLMEHKTKVDAVKPENAGFLGVSLRTVDELAVTYYGMPAGAFIDEVVEGEAAQKAGLHSKDIIVKFEGEKITTREDVLENIQYYSAGETVTLTIARQKDGEYEEFEVQVELGQKPQE